LLRPAKPRAQTQETYQVVFAPAAAYRGGIRTTARSSHWGGLQSTMKQRLVGFSLNAHRRTMITSVAKKRAVAKANRSVAGERRIPLLTHVSDM
jgi:hypothetical protein